MENTHQREPFVVVDDFNFNYPMGSRPALEGISFTVGKGEFLGITGPSGAGKTTLSLALRGLIPGVVAGKSSGSISIDGMDTRTTPIAEIGEHVGVVLQDPEMQIIGLTVEEDLAFGPENYMWPADKIRERIPDVLEITRMSGMENRETWSLSGGQKQRVAIASSLVMVPSLLILDEPTSELDPVGKEEVFETVRRLREEIDMTIIMVTHAIEQLAEVADRIIVMHEGKIVGEDEPTRLFRNIDLFHKLAGERLPHVAEVLYALEEQGYLTEESFSTREDEGIRVLSDLLENRS